MSLIDHTIKKEYRSLKDNVVQDFYLPLLGEAISYKRAVGYFVSSTLVELSKGICQLVKNGGTIKIVASPYLSNEDLEAIQKGYQDRQKIIEGALIKGIECADNDYYSQQRLCLLANLISDGKLDIHIAYTKSYKGLGLYHEKLGLIEDKNGNIVAFSGSNNETRAAMFLNYEAIDVFRSWGSSDEAERVQIKKNAFESIWTNQEEGIEVLDFPNVTKAFVEKYKKHHPNYEIDELQFDNNGMGDKGKPIQCPSEIGIPKVPDDVKFYDYQEDAISTWVAENYRGIFDMATGTGKTYTGLGAIAKIATDLNNELAVIIVAPYQHLVDQWVEDICKFNIMPIIGYSASQQKDWKTRLEKAIRDQKLRKDKAFFLFITTNATFSSLYVQEQIRKIRKPILLVVDEAHNIGARSYAKLLDDKYSYRLALSATLDRYRDEEGTKVLYSFFGKKCIEYTLERAIEEDKLTRYKYYPVLVYLNEQELHDYDELSFQMSKNVIRCSNGQVKLSKIGEIIAIQRSRVVAGAINKLIQLKTVIKQYQRDNNLLVYCGATNVLKDNEDSSTTDGGDIRQIEAVTDLLGNELQMTVSMFTSNESAEERASIKSHYSNGETQAIVAIKCLDEGVNIPGIKTAFILASSTNPKEYIQRRGRVLRKAPGKDFAEIYDFVTLPRPLQDVQGLTKEQVDREVSLVKRELARVYEFARLSCNKMENMTKVWDICDVYGLSYDEEEWNQDE